MRPPPRASARLGYGSAFGVVITFAIFTVCFVAIPLSGPAFRWTDLPAYVTWTQTQPQGLAILARLCMLFFCPLLVGLFAAIVDCASDATRVWARLGLCFAVIFAALTGLSYFVQLTAVRFSIGRGELAGLEQVTQANPYSMISAMNMAGWTLFLPLASLCAAAVFSGGRLERLIRFAFVFNGAVCLAGGIGFMLDWTAVVFWTVNFGMGGAVLLAAISLSVWFRRLSSSPAGGQYPDPDQSRSTQSGAATRPTH